MCLKFNYQETQKLKAEDRPLTLYKVYVPHGEKEFRSPFKRYYGSKFESPTTIKVSPSKRWTEWLGGDFHLFDVAAETANNRRFSTEGLHCFTDKASAEKFADEFNKEHYTHGLVFEVTSHTAYVIATGTTPADSVLDSLSDYEFPTIVVSQLTISPEEFNRNVAEMEKYNAAQKD